jgi:hypothetical protein
MAYFRTHGAARAIDDVMTTQVNPARNGRRYRAI